jgi:biopolymer transport protein ExbD
MAKPFRRRSAMAVWEMHFGPNMTPMVDVVMVILIFYMASTSFIGSEWFLRTALPKEPAAAPRQDRSREADDPFSVPPAQFELTLRRGAEGRTVASGPAFGAVSLAELPSRLAELARGTGAEDLALVIRADGGVPYGDVVRAHDAATSAGITKVGLMDTAP